MTKTHHKSALPAIAFALAALVQTVPSVASAREQGRSIPVSYGDLDLTSPQGIKTLDRRLDRAVRRVCGDRTYQNLSLQAGVSECEKGTWAHINGQRQVAINKANDRLNGVATAQRSTYELPVVASAK
ncbi:UrcA family protein [Croceibacterium sp. LX-88]|jgi:UrcA family protein|uniref:UrcA family protein n=1 Tax=Croceibacterium selenioxidans TaxID=2838833 RepID=A0ABS5W5Q2_9SPHN|nr:UrcA family protein [Croceibacterium selenioxidans]MBT2135080.1 UrcA family protein [Croceibacterium selenioxidans]